MKVCQICGKKKSIIDFSWESNMCGECYILAIGLLQQKDRIKKNLGKNIPLKELLRRTYKEEALK